MATDLPAQVEGASAPSASSRRRRGRWLSLPTSDAGLKAAHFNNGGIAAALLAPQLLVLLFFFFIPSYKALSLAFVQVDPFGAREIFVGLENFTRLFNSEIGRAH